DVPATAAVYVPDDEAVAAFAEAAGALQDQPAEADNGDETGWRARRRRGRPKAPADAQHGTEPVDEMGLEPVAEFGDGTEPVAASAESAGTEELVEATYPWQQKDEVDLDLHGAATWDPGLYPPEDEVPQRRRSGRALRWLLAR